MVECQPIFKGAIYNTTKAQNIDFFGSDLTPTQTPATFLVYLNGSGNIKVKRTNGSETIIEGLGGGTFGIGSFLILVAPGDSINFLYDAAGGGTIDTMIVVEVDTPASVTKVGERLVS